jgi:hypothetical protein
MYITRAFIRTCIPKCMAWTGQFWKAASQKMHEHHHRIAVLFKWSPWSVHVLNQWWQTKKDLEYPVDLTTTMGWSQQHFFFAAQAPGHAGTSGGSKFGRGGLAGGNGSLWGEHRKTFAVEDLMYSIFLHFFVMFSNWFVFAFSTFYRRRLASGIHQMKGRRRSRRTTNDCHWHPLAAIDCMLIFHVCTCSSTAVQDLSAGVLLQLEVECRSDCPVLVMQRWPCLVPCHVT